MIEHQARAVERRGTGIREALRFLPDNIRPLGAIMLGGPVLILGAIVQRRWQVFRDLWFLSSNPRMAMRVMAGDMVSHAFRERLMLSVTAVYGCRYCSWLHTGEALKSGIGEEEIAALLEGSVDNCSEEEAVALVYAQHWADSDARPEPEAVRRLQEAYGTEKARAIELVLHMNRIGNLSGNSLDRLLDRISLGKRGKQPQ